MVTIFITSIMALVFLIIGIIAIRYLHRICNADNHLNCNIAPIPDTAKNAPDPQTKSNPGNSIFIKHKERSVGE